MDVVKWTISDYFEQIFCVGVVGVFQMDDIGQGGPGGGCPKVNSFARTFLMDDTYL